MEKEEFINLSKAQKILTVAKYIIENNATINEVALNFGISTSSVKKYINDKHNLQSINYDVYLAVKEVQEKILMTARIKGGKIGIATPSISEFEAEEIATVMIERGWTLEQASNYFDNIPTSTIYENLMKISDKELLIGLQNLFEENNKSKGGRQ